MTPSVAEQWRKDAAEGRWTPAPGDALHECEFVRAGFRAWGLVAPDKKWRLTLTRLDFADRSPSAILEVHAPGHDMAIPSLDDFVFRHAIGINGGTNYNQCLARLSAMLGANKEDWDRRLTYLIEMAKRANAGTGNGTFSTTVAPKVSAAQPWAFHGRIREGRTMSLFGPGSAGKTTIVSGLVVSACSGTEVIPGWRPSRVYSCLVLDWDEGREEEEVRLAAICAAYGVELTGGYHYKRMSRPLSDLADDIGLYVVENGIDIAIVSPVGRAARDHGDNITAPIDELYEVLRTFGTTNILIDHVTGANMKGGAEREFGSVRKRDNARGSYSVYMQSEAIGERVVVLRNTKPDAMAPRQEPQAVRVEFDPPEGRDFVYDRITYHSDEVVENPDSDTVTSLSLRERIYAELQNGHQFEKELAESLGAQEPSVRRTLYRYQGSWFARLPSTKRWEALPMPDRPVITVPDQDVDVPSF